MDEGAAALLLPVSSSSSFITFSLILSRNNDAPVTLGKLAYIPVVCSSKASSERNVGESSEKVSSKDGMPVVSCRGSNRSSEPEGLISLFKIGGGSVVVVVVVVGSVVVVVVVVVVVEVELISAGLPF